MYPAIHAQRHPERPAFIMAGDGAATTYRDLDAASNRLAHLLRSRGLRQRDHYGVFMENNRHYVVANAAGERSGLYCTSINSFLTPQELAYIVDNSDSQVLITSRAKRDVAAQAIALCPKLRLALIVDAPSDASFLNLDEACAAFPADADRRRVARHADALFVRHHRPAQGHPAPVARQPAARTAAAVPLPEQAVALPRRHGLPLAGAALPLGAAGGGVADASATAARWSSWSTSIPSSTWR